MDDAKELSEMEEFLRELEEEERILTASPFVYPELYRPSDD